MREVTTTYSFTYNSKKNKSTSVVVGVSRSTPAYLLGLKNQATLR